MKTPYRRSLLPLLAVSVAALLVTAGSSASPLGKQAEKTIKIGFLLPLTGPFAANGMTEAEGFNLGLKTFGAGGPGYKIALKYADTMRDPATALTLSRGLVENYHASMLEGPLGTNEVEAITPYLVSKKMPVDDLALCSYPQMQAYQKAGLGFTSTWFCDTPAMTGAQWAYQVKGLRHVTIVAFDYAFGWEGAGAFADTFRKLGGTIDKFIWIPTGVLDMHSFVSQIPANTQMVWSDLGGGVASNFIKGYSALGLSGKIPLMGEVLTDASAMPGDTAQGVYMDLHYCDGLTNALNKRFVTDYTAKYGAIPGYYSEAGYTKARIVARAARLLKGDFSNTTKLMATLKTINLNTPRGLVRLNTTYDGPVENQYICQARKVNGAISNVPVFTYKNVQPWGNVLTQQEWLTHFKHDSSGRPN